MSAHDVTVDTALGLIKYLPDGWRKRYWISRVRLEIQDYRETAKENKGKKIEQYLLSRGDELETKLNEAIAFTKDAD